MMGPAGRKWLRDQSGAAAVEFAMLLPVLLIVLLGSITAFDMFRTAQSVEKATFTIGDMLAREREPLTPGRLNDMLVLMRNTVPTAHDGGLRISSFRMLNGTLQRAWWERVGNNVPNVPPVSERLPQIADGDSVLLIESFVPHPAMVAGFGISDMTFNAEAAHRPRFLPFIPFQR